MSKRKKSARKRWTIMVDEDTRACLDRLVDMSGGLTHAKIVGPALDAEERRRIAERDLLKAAEEAGL